MWPGHITVWRAGHMHFRPYKQVLQMIVVPDCDTEVASGSAGPNEIALTVPMGGIPFIMCFVPWSRAWPVSPHLNNAYVCAAACSLQISAN